MTYGPILEDWQIVEASLDDGLGHRREDGDSRGVSLDEWSYLQPFQARCGKWCQRKRLPKGPNCRTCYPNGF